MGEGRERNDGLYRPVTYLAFKIAEEMVVVFLNSVVFSALVFFTLRLKGSFVFFWLVYLVTSSVGIGAPLPCNPRNLAHAFWTAISKTPRILSAPAILETPRMLSGLLCSSIHRIGSSSAIFFRHSACVYKCWSPKSRHSAANGAGPRGQQEGGQNLQANAEECWPRSRGPAYALG